jgi:hypothetical protein
MPSSLPEPDLLLAFIRPLEQAGVEYMISGSVAAMAYGQPRLTTDIDVIVSIDLPKAIRLAQLFSSDEFYFPPVDIIATELTRETRGHFNILHIDSGFKADIYLRGTDSFRIWALERVRKMNLGEMTVRMAPPEYVIIRKLEYFREGGSEKHLRDIRLMVENSRELIDSKALTIFVQERGLESEWQKAQSVSL